MALIQLPAPLVLFPWNWNIAGYPGGTEATFVYDAVNDELVAVLQCPPDAFTLDKVSLYISTVTTPPSAGNITVAIYALDASGLPTGAALASVNIDATTITVAGRYVATGLALAITAGTFYGISFKADASYVGNITQRYGSATVAMASPFVWTNNAGAGYTRAQTRVGGLYIGLGTSTEYKKIVGFNGALADVDVQRSITDAGSPDEVGNTFTFAQPMRVVGAIWYFSSGSSDVALNLRDNAGSVQRSLTYDKDYLFATNVRGVTQMFASAYDTTENVAFELTASKSGLGGTMSIEYLDAVDNAELNALWNSSISGVTYNNGGSRATETARQYGIFPIISHIGDNSGGGGVIIPNINRNIFMTEEQMDGSQI